MYTIGVDLGGTNIAVGVVDADYHIVAKGSVPTNATRDGKEIIRDMAELCAKLTKEAGLTVDDIESVGIASPGAINSAEGIVTYANNLPFIGFPIADILKSFFPVKKVFVENDANTAAMGEAVAGAAKGVKNAVMITLGTGVGGGVIVNGKICSGFNYAGGELGHIVIQAGGVPCSCGRKGCWESYSSATALIRMTKEKLAECEEKKISTIMTEMVEKEGKVSGKTAFAAMKLGDKPASKVVDEYIAYLGCGLANIINIFQPEILVLGGGVCNEKHYLTDPLQKIMETDTYGYSFLPHTQIKIAELGNDAGIIGAAALGR